MDISNGISTWLGHIVNHPEAKTVPSYISNLLLRTQTIVELKTYCVSNKSCFFLNSEYTKEIMLMVKIKK